MKQRLPKKVKAEQEEQKWERQKGAGERGWVSMDGTSERFVLCLKGLGVFGMGEQGQNGKEANRVVKLEESNSSPLRIVEIVDDVKRLGRLGRSVWIEDLGRGGALCKDVA